MLKDFSRSVTLFCPVCGSSQFSTEMGDTCPDEAADASISICNTCGGTYTRAELIENNSDVIQANVDEVKDEAIKALKAEVRRIFK